MQPTILVHQHNWYIPEGLPDTTVAHTAQADIVLPNSFSTFMLLFRGIGNAHIVRTKVSISNTSTRSLQVKNIRKDQLLAEVCLNSFDYSLESV